MSRPDCPTSSGLGQTSLRFQWTMSRALYGKHRRKITQTHRKKIEFNLLLVGLDISDAVLCWCKYKEKKKKKCGYPRWSIDNGHLAHKRGSAHKTKKKSKKAENENSLWIIFWESRGFWRDRLLTTSYFFLQCLCIIRQTGDVNTKKLQSINGILTWWTIISSKRTIKQIYVNELRELLDWSCTKNSPVSFLCQFSRFP